MALSGQQYLIRAGEHEAVVVEVGAGLRSYSVAGVDIVPTYGDDVLAPKCCGGVLVPWPNRLRDGRYTFDETARQLPLTEPAHHNAAHGLGRWARWRVRDHGVASVTMSLDIVPQTGWPFEVRVDVTYMLDAEYGLSVTALAHNHGSGRAPFGAGFHPYLALRGHPLADVMLRLPARHRMILDEVQVPVGVQSVGATEYDFTAGRVLGALRMDDGFTDLHTEQGRGYAEVHTGSGGARLWFDETYRYLQVFTADPLIDDLPAIAIEPMTCAADAFNTGQGLIVLEPGGTWTGSWGIQPLPAAK
ncbi:MAG: aldose 1-epimerase family protein [Actinomycetota bacterium]|nr:aldose 1-epimerase family protein [Actinomycetota bacterium]